MSITISAAAAPDAFVDRMRALIADPDLRRRLAASGRDYVARALHREDVLRARLGLAPRPARRRGRTPLASRAGVA